MLKKTTEINFFKINQINANLVEGINVSQTIPKHFHNSYNIGVIVKGTRNFNYKSNNYLITSGSIFTINPGEIHSFENINDAPHSYRIISFNLDYLKNNYKGKLFPDNNIPVFKKLFFNDINFFYKINHLFEVLKTSISILEKESIFLNFIIKLFNYNCDLINPDFDYKKNHPSVKIIKDFINDNYFLNFSLEKLSNIGNLSQYHLNRIFTKEIGLPPHNYQNFIRIKKSLIFINSGYSIADVAYKTGFFDQSHFSKFFKKYTGLSPLDYKNKFINFS